MNDPIVIWPPGTFAGCHGAIGPGWFDCTSQFPEYWGTGAMVCCYGY
jgi:hypothetical protein